MATEENIISSNKAESQIRELEERYGSKNNLSALTEPQRSFLLYPSISKKRDISGGKSVSFDNRSAPEGSPPLRIVDINHYTFLRNRIPLSLWERNRIPAYKKVSGDETPKKTDEHTYLFELRDGSLIQVMFASKKAGS